MTEGSNLGIFLPLLDGVDFTGMSLLRQLAYTRLLGGLQMDLEVDVRKEIDGLFVALEQSMGMQSDWKERSFALQAMFYLTYGVSFVPDLHKVEVCTKHAEEMLASFMNQASPSEEDEMHVMALIGTSHYFGVSQERYYVYFCQQIETWKSQLELGHWKEGMERKQVLYRLLLMNRAIYMFLQDSGDCFRQVYHYYIDAYLEQPEYLEDEELSLLYALLKEGCEGQVNEEQLEVLVSELERRVICLEKDSDKYLYGYSMLMNETCYALN